MIEEKDRGRDSLMILTTLSLVFSVSVYTLSCYRGVWFLNQSL